MNKTTLKVRSTEETKEIAVRLGSLLDGGEVICLVGNLGSGKTYFTKFLAEALGVDQKDIISPTFVYWRVHEGAKFRVHHFDFYRIDDEREVEDIGFMDALDDEKGIVVIEWADKIRSYLPRVRMEIHIAVSDNEERILTISAYRQRYDHILQSLNAKK